MGAYKIICQIPQFSPGPALAGNHRPCFAPGVDAPKHRDPLRRSGARSGPGIEVCACPDKRQGRPNHPMGKRPDRKGGPGQNRSSRQSLACRYPRHHRVGSGKYGERSSTMRISTRLTIRKPGKSSAGEIQWASFTWNPRPCGFSRQRPGTGDFEHAVIHSSIIRPAANRFIRQYLGRLHGEPYEPLHPSLKEILAENYGILVYQEDVVQAAMALAGFSWGEADSLRKVISKKSREQLSDYRARFEQGCARNGISPEVVKSVWDMFTSFSGYSFCKPHSASYALVSFKSAYLKAHHPAEFMAAVLSNGGGYYSTFAYISEARRMGIEVLGPDINESRLPYTGKGKTIRTGSPPRA